MNEIPSRYNPKEAEDKWYKFWEENKLFAAKPNSFKKPFCIVIPPPNVTGILHMGHALNNTIQDILIRYQRMQGRESLWMPGTDHAGIATQNVVEKSLAKQGLKRQDLGREKFIEKVWEWKEQYGSTIIHQLKKLGASCDWTRTRFTMDEEYSKAVKTAFVALWSKKPRGLIYQDDKVINWCPRCQTALSDEEAPHRKIQGNLYYIKYPFKGSTVDHIVVATTRPETMLGDTAVAVNPKDRRYKKFIGETLILPLANREIKIISDEMVDRKFATGAVKVTPAHDPNDYLLGKKHCLQFLNIMQPDGRLNKHASGYCNMDRFQAREAIIKDLKGQGLLEKIEPHELSAGHCYRCQTIIEPYLSRQWFVKMKPLAKPAIEAVKKGKIKFYPQRWTKVYLNWMENIQDWCISRQIWWGHRIPLWYCLDCKKEAIASVEKPQGCSVCNSVNLKQDEDVLDTWFSSWLWPFATFYWPAQAQNEKRKAQSEEDLRYFYPTSVLVTAPEIIFFWVARMIMAGLEFMKDIPFKDVYIHGTVRDIEGKKMSKSQGNIIDPLEIINEYGADALRFSLISITAGGQDIFLSKERFEQGRNFANKIWNASRFILMNITASSAKINPFDSSATSNLDIINRWILSRFNSVLKDSKEALDTYRFNEAANILYGFFWHEFCDWYLEIIKPDIKNTDNQVIMLKVLENFLKIIHPFMPFLTEEIWQKLYKASGALSPQRESIMIQPWPEAQSEFINHKIEQKLNTVFQVITAIRNMRQELEIPLEKEINVICATSKKENKEILGIMSVHIKNLSKAGNLKVEAKFSPMKSSITQVFNDIHITIPLEGVIDIKKEKIKVNARIQKIDSEIKIKQRNLSNSQFLEKAPPEVIEKERERLKELRDTLERLKAIKNELS